jgi:histidinol-phosphate aminotransferase
MTSQLLLDRNENQYGPSPSCQDLLRTADLQELSLYSREYMRGVKSNLSERLGTLFGIPEERILLSYGSEDMLKQVVHCYLHRGDTMLLPHQSWWYYKSLADEKGGRTVEYMLHERQDRFVYNADEIIGLYDAHLPHVILIASPNNPTGNSIEPADLARIVAHCVESVVVLDEAYYGFSADGTDHLRELLVANPRLVILRTFSKFYALAGLRIGYACIGEGLSHLATFSARYLGFNRLSERIALAALDDTAYYREAVRKMQDDKTLYYSLFSRSEGFRAFRSDANFVLVRYPGHLRERLTRGLAQQGIVVKFLEDPGLKNCMRITIGTRDQNQRVINFLGEIFFAHSPVIATPVPVRS